MAASAQRGRELAGRYGEADEGRLLRSTAAVLTPAIFADFELREAAGKVGDRVTHSLKLTRGGDVPASRNGCVESARVRRCF